MDTLLSGLGMMVLAVASVGLWTLRVALTARGRKLGGSVTAGLEAVVFLLAFSSVMSDMQAVERVVGYALGVAAGTLLGMVLDDRLSAGQSEVRVVLEESEAALVDELRSLGWPVTTMEGQGPTGVVTVAFVAVDDARVAALLEQVARLAPESFCTIERLKSARAVRQHSGWIQVGGRLPWPLAALPRLRRAS